MGKSDMNVMTGTKVPALRFKGFNDEWVEKKLGDVLTERNVQHEPTDEYPLVSFTVENGVTPKTDRYNREFLVRTSDKKYKATEINDIVYNPANLKFGAISLNTYGKAVFSPIYVTFTVNAGIDPYYMGLFVTRDDFINFSLKYQEGTVYERMAVKSGDFLALDVSIPELSEQQAIGQFSKTIDSLIQSEEQKLEQLNALKKSFLQKMFPKKGATVPELRFDGFSGEWVEKKLGDVFKRVSVKGRTDLPFITVTETETNVREDSHQGYGNDVSDTAKAKAKVILDGQFLIDLTSYSRGLYLCRMDGLTSNAYNVLDMSAGNEKFWSEYFITHNFVQSLKSITPPGARQGKMVEVDSLLKFDIMVPEQDEQLAIGQFFKTFDELIEKQEEKVDNGKLLKKALLQKMFV